MTYSRPTAMTDTTSPIYHALAYMTECTLATIEHLKMKTQPPKGEIERQIDIALVGLDMLNAPGYEECKNDILKHPWRGRYPRVKERLGYQEETTHD